MKQNITFIMVALITFLTLLIPNTSLGLDSTSKSTLPEGYFFGASKNIDYIILLQIAISIIFVIIAFILWKKYGKDDMTVKTPEFYPPNDLNSADIGFIYKGHSEPRDIISLLIYLANKGYLRIEEYEETPLEVIKSKKFKIVKRKEYNGNNEDERTFFNNLFNNRNEVTKGDLYNKFYVILEIISKNVKRKENQEKVYEKASLRKRSLLIAMIVIVFLFMVGLSLVEVASIEAIMSTLLILGITLYLVYNKPNKGTITIVSLALVFVAFAINSGYIIQDTKYLIKFIIESICIVWLIIFLGIIKKRTPYGTEMLGKIQGLKNFIEEAEKPRLEQLNMEDPEYFYKILPYTYVLGVSNKWMKKFEDIDIEPPNWYYGYSDFSTKDFIRFMNSTYYSISSTMISKPYKGNSRFSS